MAHIHSHHAHAHTGEDAPDVSDRSLIIAIGLNVLLTFLQILGGLWSGSLSLVADALHNLNDAASLGLAFSAKRIGQRPADELRTFGYRKAETIGALVSMTALMLIGVYLLYEAMMRWFHPREVSGWTVIAVAGFALVVDAATAWLTYKAQDGSLNLRAALLHNIADALGSIAVIIAGILILLYEWHVADLLAAVLIAGYVLLQSYHVLKQSIRVLMASVPPGLDIAKVIEEIQTIDGVLEAHHVHIWQLDEQKNALEAHVVVSCDTLVEAEQIKSAIKAHVAKEFAISHATLEVEPSSNSACKTVDCR